MAADRGAVVALARRALAQGRAPLGWTVALVALVAYASPTGYRSLYPTVADRIGLVGGLAESPAVRLFFGVPHDLLRVEGFTAWRAGAMSELVVAAWALLAATRLLRGEEDNGLAERLRAAPLAPLLVAGAQLAGVLAGGALLALVTWGALVAGGIGAGGAAELAIAIASPVPVCAAVGAVTSQLAGTRREANLLGGGVLLVAFALRVAADTTTSLESLRWITPLGWAEELRPLTGWRPGLLVPLLVAPVLLLALAARLARDRDLGGVALAGRRRRVPRTRSFRGPQALAAGLERGTLVGWCAGAGAFAVVIGLLAPTIARTELPPAARRQLLHVSGADPSTAAGALGLYFSFFAVVVALYAVAQVVALRHAEASGQLEVLLAARVGRWRLLFGRGLLVVARSAILALVIAIGAFAGAAAQDAGVPLARLLEAGANLLPAALLLAGLGLLAFAAAPRHTAALAYGAVGLAYTWQQVGALLGAPPWLLDLSPFAHVAAAPAVSIEAGSALLMVAIGLACTAVASARFAARDLAGP